MLPTLNVKYIKGVGPVRAALLAKELKVQTVGDLIRICPYKYIDRTVIHRITDLKENMPHVQMKGQIVDIEEEGTGRAKRLRATFTDGTGFVDLIWFNGLKVIQNHLKINTTYLLLGKPSVYNHRFSFSHPELDDAQKTNVDSLRMQALYRTTEAMKRANITSRWMQETINRVLTEMSKSDLTDPLPEYLRQQFELWDFYKALKALHSPTSASEVSEATRRMKFEELFFLQLDILRSGLYHKTHTRGLLCQRIGEVFNTFYFNHLPFSLTGAQKRVLHEIWDDMRSGQQMNRLLQGDVGSGKTLVALMACLMAIGCNMQTCIMAPTEILAEQHLETLRQFLGNMENVRVALLTGNVKGATRRRLLADVAKGKIQILVGTHALIEPKVVFSHLGLAVIDEQHRFGVKQRAALWDKNSIAPPHILVMTATPIPRTLAMTVYGDLDVSVIDELPPGRKPIQTIHYHQNDRTKLIYGLRHQLGLGRQVYVVYPLIQESETLDLKNLEDGFVHLSEALPEYKVGKVHGKMLPADKEAAMAAFANRETQILVSTTVIEVGVNVPNASVMVVENAERFGLAQLHQLRGRVGRGADQSYCILMTRDDLSSTTQRRIQTMVDSCDGFVIAEEDMRSRGPGDFEGTAQSGMPFQLHVANIITDSDLMALCREAARAVLEHDPEEALPQHQEMWKHLKHLKGLQHNFSGIS